jgi:hypothetical protein
LLSLESKSKFGAGWYGELCPSVDLEEIERWSSKESMAEKYHNFFEELDKAKPWSNPFSLSDEFLTRPSCL